MGSDGGRRRAMQDDGGYCVSYNEIKNRKIKWKDVGG
jgi:hypothetical protein